MELECSIPGSYVIIDGEKYDVPKPVVHLVMQRGRKNLALDNKIWYLEQELHSLKKENKALKTENFKMRSGKGNG